MTDVRRALHMPDRWSMRYHEAPGSIWLGGIRLRDAGLMWFYCPCGCGELSCIVVGSRHKPAGNPTWAWNGSLTEPTLTGTVERPACGWRGILKDGYWERLQ